MKKTLLAALGLVLFAAATWAAGETIATWGLSSGANPRNLCVFDNSSPPTCVVVGSLDSTGHSFSPANFAGTSGGSGNAQTLTVPNFSLAAPRRPLLFIAGFSNNGPATLNVNGTGALPIKMNQPSGPLALGGGEIVAGNLYSVSEISNVYYLANQTVNSPGAAGGSSATLLNSGLVSGPTLNIVLSSYPGFRGYQFVLTSLLPVTNLTSLIMRVSSDGGVTYDAGANYSYRTVIGSATNATQFQLSGSASAQINNSYAGYSGVITVLNPGAAVYTSMVANGVSTTGGATIEGDLVQGQHTLAQATNAVQFLFSAGNIASGGWALYGMN